MYVSLGFTKVRLTVPGKATLWAFNTLQPGIYRNQGNGHYLQSSFI